MSHGVYAGSFDPFTNGHLDILKQSLELFDYIDIVIADNSAKQRYISKKDTKELILEVLRDNHIRTVKVVEWDGLVADYCSQQGITYLIRGLRNNLDYSYEENLAKINSRLNSKLSTVYFRSSTKWETCSSSLVRELWKTRCDLVREYLPKNIYEYLRKKGE